MPWVAPVRRSAGGDTWDQPGGSKNFTVQANAGDLVVVTLITSNYPLVIQSVSGGGVPFDWWSNRERGSGYGNAYTFSGVSPTTQTFTLNVTTVNYVNATVYYQLIRWYVFGSHGGPGYHGAWRGGGEAWMYANQNTEKSAFVHNHVDWNATAPTGTWLTTAGPASDGVVVRAGAGIYWAASHLDSTGLNQKTLGTSGSTSTRLTGASLEIKGIYSDVTGPGAPSSIAATPLTDTQIRVDWGASTDDVGVTGYRIYDNGVQIGQVASNVFTFTHSGLTAESAHQYTVRGYDAAGNLGTVSTIANATTFATSVNKLFLGTTKPSFRLGSQLVKKLYLGDQQVWP